MAIPKRLRFEILRRDNYTCRYCGASAPDVSLTIDHVIPEALGGTDDPGNLVAACSACNGGKSSLPPDAPLVADVAADAERWAAAIRMAAEELQLHNNTAVYEAVVSAWTSYRRHEIPAGYRETIDKFLATGLPADDIIAMARVADSKSNVNNRWSYFCGCCWKRVTALQERASEIFAAETAVAAQPEPEPTPPPIVSERGDLSDVTRWFKPIWFGEAWEAGRRRWVPVHVDSLEVARQEAEEQGLQPYDKGYVDAEGRVYITNAPCPADWIETVARFLDAGVTKDAIENLVRQVMNSSLAENLWQHFAEYCEWDLVAMSEEPDG